MTIDPVGHRRESRTPRTDRRRGRQATGRVSCADACAARVSSAVLPRAKTSGLACRVGIQAPEPQARWTASRRSALRRRDCLHGRRRRRDTCRRSPVSARRHLRRPHRAPARAAGDPALRAARSQRRSLRRARASRSRSRRSRAARVARPRTPDLRTTPPDLRTRASRIRRPCERPPRCRVPAQRDRILQATRAAAETPGPGSTVRA